MTEEKERLATAGARVLIEGAASTALWKPIHDSFAAWFRRHALTETELHLSRLERLGRRFRVLNSLNPIQERRRWRFRLLDVLMRASSSAAAAIELATLIDEFASALAARPREERLEFRDHLDFRGSTFRGTVAAVQHNHYGAIPSPAAWRPVGQVGPVEFGVGPTRRVLGLPDVPPYVQRDCDEDLRIHLAHNGLVLILGEPYAGKSYTAWHGVQSLKRHILYAPYPGDDLRAVLSVLDGNPGEYVIWLDELTDHLGSGGLDLKLLGRFTSLGAVMLGTISPEEYYRRRSGTAPGERVIAAARTVELAREWSDAELERLAGLDDPRAYPAYMWSGREGAASYFAIGHLLFDEWRRVGTQVSHPRGQLLVRAAVDLARCGVRGAVPVELLRRVHEHYGAEERESFEDALAWATKPLFGASGLLVQGDEAQTWRVYGALVAEATRADGNLEPVPDEVWWTLLDESGPDFVVDRDAILDGARAAFLSRLNGEDTALMIAFSGRVGPDERCALLSRAADAGDWRGAEALAAFLMTRGDTTQAMPYLEQAAAAGGSWAATTLGKLLRDQAEAWLRIAAEAGDPVAAHELGDTLVGSGREDEALLWYRRAAAAGRREVAVSLGALLSSWRAPEADVWLCYAAARGDARGAGELGVHLSWEPEADEVKLVPYYQPAAHAGDASAAFNLGQWMARQDRFDEAMELYRQALQGGVSEAETAIGVLLDLQGRMAEAADWYQRVEVADTYRWAGTANPIGLPGVLPEPPRPPDGTTPTPDTVKE
ncbi:tetratricopeptide repeat protein [Streptomyces sp. NRRL F-525]|uniref:tetratricopeptide repeat protein n=1 Tax=Streptomyces sp. NRRL F-525 TaxID=1463861 RepID=UPI000AB2CB9F|nr:tetratricopeptide repeat protein [Streptomyces sp. NRRL F-525]